MFNMYKGFNNNKINADRHSTWQALLRRYKNIESAQSPDINNARKLLGQTPLIKMYKATNGIAITFAQRLSQMNTQRNNTRHFIIIET